MRHLLIISLLLNGVLFALVARRALQKPDLAFAREPRMQMAQHGSVSASKRTQHPSPDTRTAMMGALRLAVSAVEARTLAKTRSATTP